MTRPIVHDMHSWAIAIMEHHIALFERVIAEYPELLTTRRSDVNLWRIRLRKSCMSLTDR